MSDEPQPRLGEPRGGVRLPVLQEVVEHGVQPGVRRTPGLHQVVVEAELVDRPDGGLGVRVRREEHPLGLRGDLQGTGQELDAAHPRHALVDDQERHRLAATDDLLDDAEARLAGVRQQDAMARAVPVPQVALDRAADRRVVVDRQDQGAHGRWSHFRATLLDLHRSEEARDRPNVRPGERMLRRPLDRIRGVGDEGVRRSRTRRHPCRGRPGSRHTGADLTGGRAPVRRYIPDLIQDILAGRLDPSP